MQRLHRPTIGIIALVLLSAAGWMAYTGEHHGGLFAACIRVGAVMAVLWLALPESVPPINLWVLAGALVFLLYLGKMPVALRVALLVLSPLLLALFWPQVRKLRAWWKDGQESASKSSEESRTR